MRSTREAKRLHEGGRKVKVTVDGEMERQRRRAAVVLWPKEEVKESACKEEFGSYCAQTPQ